MMTQHLVQAYEQAPWRIQIQRGILILLTIVGFVIIAVIYLNISAETYAAGRDVQIAEYEIEQHEREIADLRTKLALMTSSAEMKKRAEQLGYVQVNDPNQMVFVVVPGYTGRQLDLAQETDSISNPANSLIKPIYTQSLWEYLFQGAMKIEKTTKGRQP